MLHQLSRPTRALLSAALLLLLAYPLFFHDLAQRDLWSSHEGRAAQDASVILETGHWGLPRLYNGWAELQKPPLYYWLVAAIGWLRGGVVDGWAVRLPAAGAAAGCALALLFFGMQRGRKATALLAPLILVTMVHFTWMARVGRIDMPLSLTVTITLAGYYLGRQARRERQGRAAVAWLVLAYASAAVAVLLKGPVGLILPGMVVLVHLLVESRNAHGQLGGMLSRPFLNARVPSTSGWAAKAWHGFRGSARSLGHELGIWWGLPFILAVVLPWFLWVNHETQGEFFRVFFLRHNLQRGLGGDDQFESHFHPWWFYFSRLAVDLQPWSLLLPLAAWSLWRNGEWRSDPEARFGAVWFVTMTLLLSILEYKRADYLLPAYPGAALLLGCAAERWLGRLSIRKQRLAWGGLAVVVLMLAGGWMVFVDVFLPRWEPAREHRSFAEVVRRRVPQPGLVILFRVEVHDFVYHLGRSVDRIWEWENLDIWACQPVPVYVVMPENELKNWPDQLEAGRLYRVLSNDEVAGVPHEQPLVLVCTRPVEQ